MIGPLGGRLPGGGLPDHGQGGQRGQAGQHVPADDLGPDRVLDRPGGRVQIVGAIHVQRPEPAVQPGQVRGAVGESGVVGVLQRRAPIHRRGELRRGVQVVVHRRPGRELTLGGDDAYHAQRRAQGGGWIGRASVELGHTGQLGVDHRADPHAVVLGQREGCQHLAGIGWVGHPPGQQHHQPGQLLRWHLVDQGVLGVDRFAAGRAAKCDRESRWHRRHRHGVRQPGQLRQRRPAVDDDVVAVPGGEPGQSGRGPAACGRRGQHEPTRQGHEHAEGQPRLPVLAQPPAKHHDHGPHSHPPPRPPPARPSEHGLDPGHAPRWPATSVPSCQHAGYMRVTRIDPASAPGVDLNR